MNSQWLKGQFECNPDKSKAGLARALNLEPPAISKILSGARQIKAQEYNLMRQYFGLPVDGDKVSAVPENAYRLETLAGGSSGLHETSKTQENSWIIPAEILSQRTQASPEKIKIFNVQESLMEPNFKRGEHVLIDLSDKTPSPPGAFIISDGFGVMLRYCEFLPHSTPAEIRVSAAQSSFQMQTLEQGDFDIIGRVIAKLQWL